MKKNTNLFLLGLLLVAGSLHAQTPMSIPNGSFEQWTSHSGYSVSAFIFSVPVYDTFSTPSVWDYPAYPVNETVTYMGFNVNINTSIPIVKTTRETGVVPDGTKAVKLQTIMIEDIVNSTVLSLAGDNIDPSLTEEIIPSILSTGVIDIEAFIPLISDLMSGSDDITTMLPTLLAEDVNDYITGGLALGDFNPGRLTGSYKYHSAIGGDNGGVVLLGTHYNTVTHRREVVGCGFNTALTDVDTYTPFETLYTPLSELLPNSPNIAPDSLIVLLLSSAGENRQQGSYLCLDNLMLWSAPDDTCADITTLTAVPQIHEAALNWSVTDPASVFEVTYGTAGYTPGNGSSFITTATSMTLTGLNANTTYDIFVRTKCPDDLYGEWSTVQFTTLMDTCAGISTITAEPQIHEAVLNWSTTGTAANYEIEYGAAGFTPGNGTTVTSSATTLTLTELDANTTYNVYVRSHCSGNTYGDWSNVQFTTLADTCATVLGLSVENTVYDAFDQMVLTWGGSSQPDHWEVEYGPHDFVLGTGTMVSTTNSQFEIYPLENNGILSPNTWYDFYVRSVCSDNIYGDWDSVQYRTHCAKVSSPVVNGDNTTVTANNRIDGYTISWTDTTDTPGWGLYYGIYSSQFPDNWGTYVEVDTPWFEFPPLLADRTYSVEISAHCGEDNIGDIVWVNFTTPAVSGIENIGAVTMTVIPNPAHGQCTVTISGNQPADLKLYSLDGRLLQSARSAGQPVTLQLPEQGLFLLHATTETGTTTLKIVSK